MTEATHTAVITITGQNSTMQQGNGTGTGAAPGTFFVNSACTVQASPAPTGAFANAAGQVAAAINISGASPPFSLSAGDMYTMTLVPFTPPQSTGTGGSTT